MANPGQAISQYHHYIPQFILRNFAHPYVAPTAKKRRRKKNDPHPGDHMLHAIDMAKDVPEMVEVLAKRTFGQQDMYRDFVGAANQQDLEKQLSRLESNASMVIRKIQKAFESGDQAVWIERRERNLLRKFLFVMKYRGSSFWRRFRHDNSKEYVANDKALLLEYMDAKGFVRPLDVWFSNIKTILELDMDLEGKWMAELPKRMFPTDAEWYISHTQQMFLAFCTPSSPRDEFILTDNSYNVYEGPSSEMVDPTSGASVGTRWTNYHEFSPISPRLILVLRSMLLPAPEEDSNENIKQWRRTLYQLNAGQHAAPWKTDSILADLPVSKARNSYSTVTDHGIQLIVGEDGSARSNHRFCFRFFPTSSEHTHKINGIFLENASKCLNIAYASLSALQRSLEYYLTVPNGEGFKVMEGGSDDPRLICLKKLERVMKDLGSKKTLVYQDRPDVLTWEDQGAHFERALDSLPDKPSPHMKLHMRLGASTAVHGLGCQLTHTYRRDRCNVARGLRPSAENVEYENQGRRLVQGAGRNHSRTNPCEPEGSILSAPSSTGVVLSRMHPKHGIERRPSSTGRHSCQG
jgi:hypothetical protein